MSQEKLSEALAAYDAAFAEQPVPARALFAAAAVLDRPVVETANLLLAGGHLAMVFQRRTHKNPEVVRIVRRTPKTQEA
jgi:L-alanine-DL-glutamate epimerase-like enolase superfamily enzyme